MLRTEKGPSVKMVQNGEATYPESFWCHDGGRREEGKESRPDDQQLTNSQVVIGMAMRQKDDSARSKPERFGRAENSLCPKLMNVLKGIHGPFSVLVCMCLCV